MNFTEFTTGWRWFSTHSIKSERIERGVWDRRWLPSLKMIARAAIFVSYIAPLKPCSHSLRIRLDARIRNDPWWSLRIAVSVAYRAWFLPNRCAV